MAVVSALRAGVDGRLVLVVATLLVVAGYRLVRTRGRRPTAITTRTWEAFQQGLAWELARLDADTKVIISAVAERSVYAQCTRHADLLHAETVSNRFLRGALRHSAEQEQRLASAGWQPPDERTVNWWVDRPGLLSAADSQHLAALFVLALHEVQGIAHPQALEYRAWNDATGTRVDLPGLHPAER